MVAETSKSENLEQTNDCQDFGAQLRRDAEIVSNVRVSGAFKDSAKGLLGAVGQLWTAIATSKGSEESASEAETAAHK